MAKPTDLELSAGPSSPTLSLQPGQRLDSHFRWVILALVFFGTTVNYIDRQVMNVLGPYLRERYNISKVEWGDIGQAFAFCYAIGQMASGRLLDKVGTRVGYALALVAWSISAMLHAVAIGFGGFIAPVVGLLYKVPLLNRFLGAPPGGPASGFMFMRGMLGVSEAPNFPAATKTISEWFPKKERALAMGVVNAGTNVGLLIAAAFVPLLVRTCGWEWTFVGTGAVGLLCMSFWLPFYRRPHEHPRVSATELAYINSDPPEPTVKMPWRTLLKYRQTWAFALAKFLTDAMWLFYIVWIAQFFKDRHKLDLAEVGLPMVVVFLLADVGSIAGGWLSSSMIKRGYSINAARKTALFFCALCVVPIVFADSPHKWVSVFMLGTAMAAHQGFSSNLYTLVSDTFPKYVVASVAGLGGTFGYIGGAIFSGLTGRILTWTNNQYIILFVIAASAYLLAFAIIHALMPRLQPAIIGASPSSQENPPPGSVG